MKTMKHLAAIVVVGMSLVATSCSSKPCCPYPKGPETKYPFFTAEPQWICPRAATNLKYGVGYESDGEPCDPQESVMKVENQTERTMLPGGFYKAGDGVYQSSPPPAPLAGTLMQVNQDSTLQLSASGEEKCKQAVKLAASQQVVNTGDFYLLCCDTSPQLTSGQTALAECASDVFGPGVRVERVANSSGVKNVNPVQVAITHQTVSDPNVKLDKETIAHHGLTPNGLWTLQVPNRSEAADFARGAKQVCAKIYLGCP